MRKLPFLLVLLLMSLMLLAAAASAHAAGLPLPAPALSLPGDDEEAEAAEADDEAEAAGDEEEAGEDEGEDCETEDDEEAELCEEAEEQEEAEECVLESASASFTAAPAAGQVRLRIRYRAFEPASVLVDTGLRGAKGSLHLGSERARLRRAGVFRHSFGLGAKQMTKALAARELDVSLHPVGTPSRCRLELSTPGPHRAR